MELGCVSNEASWTLRKTDMACFLSYTESTLSKKKIIKFVGGLFKEGEGPAIERRAQGMLTESECYWSKLYTCMKIS